MDPNRLDDGLTRREVRHSLRALDLDHLTIVTEHLYLLKPTRPTRFFQRRYTWTGKGAEGRPVVDPHADEAGHTSHRLQGPVILEKERQRIMVVDLGTTVDETETITVKVSHRFVDTANDFKRYLGHTAYEGCQKISLRVTLPRGPWPMHRVTRRAGEDHHQSRAVAVGVESMLRRAPVVQYSWDIEDPSPRYSYSLDWQVPTRRNGE